MLKAQGALKKKRTKHLQGPVFGPCCLSSCLVVLSSLYACCFCSCPFLIKGFRQFYWVFHVFFLGGGVTPLFECPFGGLLGLLASRET